MTKIEQLTLDYLDSIPKIGTMNRTKIPWCDWSWNPNGQGCPHKCWFSATFSCAPTAEQQSQEKQLGVTEENESEFR